MIDGFGMICLNACSLYILFPVYFSMNTWNLDVFMKTYSIHRSGGLLVFWDPFSWYIMHHICEIYLVSLIVWATKKSNNFHGGRLTNELVVVYVHFYTPMFKRSNLTAFVKIYFANKANGEPRERGHWNHISPEIYLCQKIAIGN